MRENVYTYPHSSFLSLEKDMGIIVDLIMKNNNLKKLLYYTSADALSKPNLTPKETKELFQKNIKLVPRVNLENTMENYLVVVFDDFATNNNNPQFRDNILEFDILCPYEEYNLKDFELRPFKIAAEIDSMLNEKRLTGIGKLNFLGAKQFGASDDYGGLCLLYGIIHGEEDKKSMPNPIDQDSMVENFDEIFNN